MCCSHVVRCCCAPLKLPVILTFQAAFLNRVELCVLSVCRCSAQEEKLNMPEGVYTKVVKSKEEKEKELERVRRSCCGNYSRTVFIDVFTT